MDAQSAYSPPTYKKITECNITDHGVEHEQYFQGHGIACSDYTHCATGCGEDPWEAMKDAIEGLATQPELFDYDMDALEDEIRAEYPDLDDTAKMMAASVSKYLRHNPDNDSDICVDDWCEHHYYLSIDLRIA